MKNLGGRGRGGFKEAYVVYVCRTSVKGAYVECVCVCRTSGGGGLMWTYVCRTSGGGGGAYVECMYA